MDTQTDTMGNVTTYDYDRNKGTLNWVKVGTENDPSITSYTYDNMNRTTAVENGDSKVSYVYDDDYLTTITHRNIYEENPNQTENTELNTIYQFEYGNFGLLNKVIVGDDNESTVDEVEETALITHEYNTKDQGFTLAKSTYGNSHSVAYAYDDLFRTKSITYDDGNAATAPVLAVEYQYDNNGNLGILKDHLGNRTVKYLYDASDRLMKVDSEHLTVGWEYDDLNNLTKQKYVVNEGYFTYNLRGKAEVVTAYTYDKDNRPTKITSQVTGSTKDYDAGLVSANYSYDAYGRNNSTVYKHGEDTDVLTRTIGYVNPSSTTTTSIIHTLNNHTDLYDKTYTYTYDAQGNITSISDGTDTITYVYDDLNQLVRENNPTLGENGETWVYTYDLGGNITSKTKYDYTTAANPTGGTVIRYEYTNENWPDLLTKYNDQEIESDAIGNIIDDGTWTYTWQNGRQLAGMTKAGTEISYTYDSDGMRTSKTVNGTTTKYMYYGGQLVAMDTEFGPVYFHYNLDGVVAMEVQNITLYYAKNIHGDVVALLDTNGCPVVEYTYDAWGNVTSTTGIYATTFGEYNPFRYRSYVYDIETGLYYLQSRYYSPEFGRFICSDSTNVVSITPTKLTDKNLFAYCDNNPVMRIDSGGDFWLGLTAACAAIGFVGQLASDVVTSCKNGEWTPSNWQTYAGSILGSVAGGVTLALSSSTEAADMVSGTVSAATTMILENATGVSDRHPVEIGLLALSNGFYSLEIPILGKGVFGIANPFGELFEEAIKNRMLGAIDIFDGLVAETLSGLVSGGYDALVPDLPKSNGSSSSKLKEGQYLYNGLIYEH